MKRIVLGSGTLYCVLYKDEIPADYSTIEKEENILGAIKGGASIEYENERYTAVDDSGKVKKSRMTGESAKLKAGLISFNGKTLEQLCNTARATETTGKRITKIGGLDNYVERYYIYLFVHKDAIDGDIRVLIVGNNSVGLSIELKNDEETQLDPEFEAYPLIDDEGTLILYEEQILPAA